MPNDIQTACLPAALHRPDPEDQKAGLVSGYGLEPGKNSHHPDSHPGVKIQPLPRPQGAGHRTKEGGGRDLDERK